MLNLYPYLIQNLLFF